MNKIAVYWHRLPHPLQAAIMLFIGAATGVIRHVVENPNACMSSTCWKGYVASAVHAGVLAVVALYVPANLGNPTAPKQ